MGCFPSRHWTRLGRVPLHVLDGQGQGVLIAGRKIDEAHAEAAVRVRMDHLADQPRPTGQRQIQFESNPRARRKWRTRFQKTPAHAQVPDEAIALDQCAGHRRSAPVAVKPSRHARVDSLLRCHRFRTAPLNLVTARLWAQAPPPTDGPDRSGHP